MSSTRLPGSRRLAPPPSTMRDADIRAALRRNVESADADAAIIDELGIRCGTVRVDLAVVNGHLKGYEIKSPADSLRRLPGQIAAYSAVLDFASIVVDGSHLEGAVEIVPAWWEILLVEPGACGPLLWVLRVGHPNPAINARTLAELLWYAETMAILEAKGATRGVRGRARSFAWDRLVEVCTLDEIRAAVRELLKRRAA